MTKGIRRGEKLAKAEKKKYYAKYSNRKSLEVIIQAQRNRMLKNE
jgi:hypothetical protein